MSELFCPKCGSSQLTANKKGFSGKKAVAGAILTGGIGILAGTIGSNKVKITCLSCGHEFLPGEGAKSPDQYKNSASFGKGEAIGCVLLIGIVLIVGMFLKMCSGGNEVKLTAAEEERINKTVDSTLNPLKYRNDIEGDFIYKKTALFENLTNSHVLADEIKAKSDSLTKALLRKTNNRLTDWYGEVISVDMFKGENLDIAISIQPKKFIRNTDSKSSITIEATQGDSKKYGYKGINRYGKLSKKVKKLKEGDKIIFNANVLSSSDNIESTGLNLSTLLHIELIDIRKE